jgi:hypothetical protein
MRSSRLGVALVACLGVMIAVPAAAQSQWDADAPVVIGLVKNDLLITVAPLEFTGCTSGEMGVYLPGMPELDVWSGFFVYDEGAPLWEMHWVFTPVSSVNITFQNDAWIRVFEFEDGDILSYLLDPCGFYSSRPFIAEGPGRFNFSSADDGLTGPGANSWGYTMKGDLYDYGYCSDGKSPRLLWLQKWVSFSESDFTDAKVTVSKGPTLTCK